MSVPSQGKWGRQTAPGKDMFSSYRHKHNTASCNTYSEVNSLLSAATQSKNNSMLWKKLRSQDSYLGFSAFSHKHSEISQDSIFGPCSNICESPRS